MTSDYFSDSSTVWTSQGHHDCLAWPNKPICNLLDQICIVLNMDWSPSAVLNGWLLTYLRNIEGDQNKTTASTKITGNNSDNHRKGSGIESRTNWIQIVPPVSGQCRSKQVNSWSENCDSSTSVVLTSYNRHRPPFWKPFCLLLDRRSLLAPCHQNLWLKCCQ